MAKEQFRAPHLEGHPDPDFARINKSTKSKIKQIVEKDSLEPVGDCFKKEDALIAWGKRVAPEFSCADLNEMILELKEELEEAHGAAIPLSEVYDIVLSFKPQHICSGHTGPDNDKIAYVWSTEDGISPYLKDNILGFTVLSHPELYPHSELLKTALSEEDEE